MSTIQAVVRNGKLETKERIDLPDGTSVDLTLTAATADGVDESDTSPEGIRKWIEWSERVNPITSSCEEIREILESERAWRKQWKRITRTITR